MTAQLFLTTLAHGRVGVWDEVAVVVLAVLTAGLIAALAIGGRRWFAAEEEGDGTQGPTG